MDTSAGRTATSVPSRGPKPSFGGISDGKGRRESGGKRAGPPFAVIVEQKEGTRMGILGWILFGLVVGALAKLVMPGRDPGGIIVTILLGVVGALLGGFLGRALGLYNEGEPAGFIGALVGAILVLAIYRMATGRRRLA
jgi:uncharacterized membrane protein YeaQ/YmgE (transglycosylase-associated protein family)